MIRIVILLAFFVAGCSSMGPKADNQNQDWTVFGKWVSKDGYTIEIFDNGKYQLCSTDSCDVSRHVVDNKGFSTSLLKFCQLDSLLSIKDKISSCDDQISKKANNIENKADVEFFPSYFKRDCGVNLDLCRPIFRFETEGNAVLSFEKELQ